MRDADNKQQVGEYVIEYNATSTTARQINNLALGDDPKGKGGIRYNKAEGQSIQKNVVTNNSSPEALRAIMQL
ncbi:hypothetical protein PG984_010702 [Apiospora sp. TS-2023a]